MAAEPDAKKKPAPKGTALRATVTPLGSFAKDVKLEVLGLPPRVIKKRVGEGLERV